MILVGRAQGQRRTGSGHGENPTPRLLPEGPPSPPVLGVQRSQERTFWKVCSTSPLHPELEPAAAKATLNLNSVGIQLTDGWLSLGPPLGAWAWGVRARPAQDKAALRAVGVEGSECVCPVPGDGLRAQRGAHIWKVSGLRPGLRPGQPEGHACVPAAVHTPIRFPPRQGPFVRFHLVPGLPRPPAQTAAGSICLRPHSSAPEGKHR